MVKHINYAIEENSFSYEIDEESVSEEATIDGFYVVHTSLDSKDYTSEDAVETYKNLSNLESAFRILKTTRLEISPIYHWTEGRIRSHVFLCMLSSYVEWHLQKQLQPLLYADAQKEQGKQKRATPLSPAKKSNSALQKAVSHLTENSEAVHSMHTILSFL